LSQFDTTHHVISAWRRLMVMIVHLHQRLLNDTFTSLTLHQLDQQADDW